MIIERVFSFMLAACLGLGGQSLADLARQEAERRKALEGVEGKVIQGNLENSGAEGNVTTSTATTGSSHISKSTSQNRSPKSYRSTIQKLDQSIMKTEERLKLLYSRLQEVRWVLPKAGRSSRRSGSTDPKSRIQAEIDKLEIQLKQIRKQRAEVYEEGKKAGFLPGELDGKGIIP